MHMINKAGVEPTRWFCTWMAVCSALALGWACDVRADCPTTGLPKTFAYGPIAVSNGLAVGSVIPGTEQSFVLSGQCSVKFANKAIVACPSLQYPVPATTDVYSTGLPGVGMRLRNSSGTAIIGSGQCDERFSLGTIDSKGNFNISGTLELVKTGPITAGTITPTASTGTYYTGVFAAGVLLNDGNSSLSIAAGTVIRPVTCGVTSATANQVISMSPISVAMLASANAVAARTPFSIALNCDSGIRVSVTFDSASGDSGIRSVLASTGSATGVGVEILDVSQSPIAIGAALQLTSNTTANPSFQFYTQYRRLGAAGVTTGTVRASTVFTMSYE